MSKGLNKCFFIGNLGRDPEVKSSKDGLAIAKFSIGVSEKFKDKETTEWVNIVTFGKLAEIAEKYLHKGDRVHVIARLKTDQYEKDGEKKYFTQFIAEEFTMLSAKSGESRELPAKAPVEIYDDDIPF